MESINNNEVLLENMPIDKYYGMPLELYESLMDYVDAGLSEE